MIKWEKLQSSAGAKVKRTWNPWEEKNDSTQKAFNGLRSLIVMIGSFLQLLTVYIIVFFQTVKVGLILRSFEFRESCNVSPSPTSSLRPRPSCSANKPTTARKKKWVLDFAWIAYFLQILLFEIIQSYHGKYYIFYNF